jgi:hypothetical protein
MRSDLVVHPQVQISARRRADDQRERRAHLEEVPADID